MTVRVMEGHVLDVLRSILSNTFQCAATSPPYYGLRDYGLPPQVWGGEAEHEHGWGTADTRKYGNLNEGFNHRWNPNWAEGGKQDHARPREVSTGAFCACGAWLGSLGLEPTPELYVEHLVSVFREVRRTLRPDGVCWVNLGDSYAGSGKGPSNGLQPEACQIGKRNAGQFANGQAPTEWLPVPSGCKAKDLLGMPWMVAFALRADGWYLRAEIIWSKPNPMPESVTDRPTKAHETVFLLSKQRTYFYDADAIREPLMAELHSPGNRPEFGEVQRNDFGTDRMTAVWGNPAGRNKRSVWEIATAPFPSAHFATWPPKLVEPMLLAGTSEKGCCPECGAPWERVLMAESPDGRRGQVKNRKAYDAEGRPLMGDNMIDHGVRGSWNSGGQVLKRETTGWRPTCAHDAAPVPCQILDPFGGAGTTGLVADRLGRDCTLVELNPAYASMARERIEQDAPLFVDVA